MIDVIVIMVLCEVEIVCVVMFGGVVYYFIKLFMLVVL